MRYQLVLYANARQDLLSLRAYLMENFDTTTQTRVINEIFNTIEKLRDYPNMGIAVNRLVGISIYLEGYYVLKTAKNIILYDMDKSRHEIDILRVFSNRQNFTGEIQRYLEFLEPK